VNDYLFVIPITIAGIIGVMSPGPSFLFVAQTTLNKSREHGLATSLGLGTGAAIFTLLSCFGLFVILEAAPFLYGTLKVLGGIYLFYLAYKIWNSSDNNNESSSIVIQDNTVKGKGYMKSFFFGLLTQLSNPKTAIVIGSVIMAFLPHEVPPYTFLILTVLTFITDSGWYCIVAVALSTARAKKVYDRFKTHINRVASGLMALLGTKLALNL